MAKRKRNPAAATADDDDHNLLLPQVRLLDPPLPSSPQPPARNATTDSVLTRIPSPTMPSITPRPQPS